ncbi:MAG: HU family DNA-binding protein [Magnetococcales bacterium]|nr:HU family DNA-binding protein [Magnetococcales bacterium]
MTLSDLKKRIAAQAELSEAQADRAVKAMVASLGEALAKGDKAALPGLGSFRVTVRETRKGRNPQTGEAIVIPAANRVRFKAAKALNQRLNPNPKPVRLAEEPHDRLKNSPLERPSEPQIKRRSARPFEMDRRSAPRIKVNVGSVLLHGIDEQGEAILVKAVDISKNAIRIKAPTIPPLRFTRLTCPGQNVSLGIKEAHINYRASDRGEITVLLSAFDDDVGGLMRWIELITRIGQRG